MANCEYFIDDCKSCKYAVGADGCFALYSDADRALIARTKISIAFVIVFDDQT